MKRVSCAIALSIVMGGAASAQSVSGSAYEDRNGNGQKDAGEPALPGVSIELFGTRDAGGAFDQSMSTAADGSYSLAPGNGCFLLRPADPAGWRGSFARFDGTIDTTPGYTHPVGYPRLAKIDQGIATR